MRNKERRGGRGRQGGGAECLFPQALDAGDPAEELRIYQQEGASPHPPLQARQRVIARPRPSPVHLQGSAVIGPGACTGSGKRPSVTESPSAGLGWEGAGMPMQPTPSQHWEAMADLPNATFPRRPFLSSRMSQPMTPQALAAPSQPPRTMMP